MKSLLPILSLLIVFSSCTTAYRSGQTPDDVCYSPERPKEEYVRTEKEDDRRYRNEYEYRDDRYTRMRVRNRRFSTLDADYYYNYRPYYSYSPYYYNPYYSHNYWNYCYNPYSNVVRVPVKTVYSAPRTFNMNVYNNPANTYSNPKGIKVNTGTSNTTRTSSGSRSSGGFLRDVFRGSSDSGSSGSSSSGSSSSGSSRSSGSSSSSSGSSSSGSSSGASKAGVRKF